MLQHRLICYHISLIHGLVKVVINLLALLIDHGPALVDDFDLFSLVTFYCDLQTLLVLSDILDLLL